jgi:Zn-dependent protease
VENLDIGTIVIIYVVFLFSTVLHELSHAVMAYQWGDSTAKDLGRFTLNPLPHIDPIGTVLMPLLMLFMSGGSGIMGWASTPVDRSRMRDPRWGDFWTSFAGPLTNLAIAIISAILLKIVYSSAGVGLGDYRRSISFLLSTSMQLNLFLMVLNLLPIPPLDGGHMLRNLLPERFNDLFEQIGQFGIIILIAVAASGLLSKLVDPLVSLAYSVL